MTLGIGEPFTMTLAVAAMFAFLLAMPVILFQIYAFIIPAFTREERRAAIPLLSLIPFLFCAGVAFGYFLVLPPAVRFLQNFNTDEFNVLVQAKDYYKFVALTLLSTGVVFQVPVGILALTRLGADYRFETTVLAPAGLSADGRVAGPLILVGGGDPNLSGREIPYRVDSPRGDGLEAVRDGAVVRRSRVGTEHACSMGQGSDAHASMRRNCLI